MVSCNSVDDKLKHATNMIEKDIIHFKQFNYLYPFTTENISGYLDYFDLKDKSLLTVGSSSDQVLNAIICGSKDITLYDICPFIKEYYYLKMAAIKTLTREEYLKFFSYLHYSYYFINNNKTFDNKTFSKINECLQELDEESSYFWYELFKKYKGKLIRKKLFNADEISLKVNKMVNRYLFSCDEYNNLKEMIDKANVIFKCADIFNIESDKKYDNIFLSNILAYTELKKYIIFFNKIKELLNEDGKMLYSYLYDTDCSDIYIDDASSRYTKDEIIESISESLNFISFQGNSGLSVNDNRMTDSIITYKKSKKI